MDISDFIVLSGQPKLKSVNKTKIYIYNTTTTQNISKESIATTNELAGIESLTQLVEMSKVVPLY